MVYKISGVSKEFKDIVSARKFAIAQLLNVPKPQGSISIYKANAHPGYYEETLHKVFLAWNDTNTILTYQHRKGFWKMVYESGALSEGYFSTTQHTAIGTPFTMVDTKGWRADRPKEFATIQSGKYNVWIKKPVKELDKLWNKQFR